MEEFEDDDFSDLYADVVVQASSAISAMHRLTGMHPVEDEVSHNSTRREKELRDGFRGGSHKINELDAVCEDTKGEEEDGGGGSADMPLENGDASGTESEDDLDSGSDDGYEQKLDENHESDRYDNRTRGTQCEEDEKRRRGIDGNEKSLNGGDHKSLKCKSWRINKKGVDEMADNVHKSCKRGRDVEDYQSNIGRKCGGSNNASESGRPLYIDKCESVLISDSEEDNHREVSDDDSDGMTVETLDDTNRRRTRSISNEVSSAVEPDSSESGWSQHGRGSFCSPSPHAANGDKYEKSHKYSRHTSSTFTRQLQVEITRESHPSKDSKCHANKRVTRDGRYCVRQRSDTQKHFRQSRRSYDASLPKTRQTDKVASHAINDVYNRNVRHEKQRAMINFGSDLDDVSYYSHSGRILTHSGRIFPDYCLGPTYLKKQYPYIRPSCRLKDGWSDDHKLNERQIYLKRTFNKMDFEALEDDRHLNDRRHPIQANIKGSSKLMPKYSSADNLRGAQFHDEVDAIHSRRAKDDYLSSLHKSDNKFVEDTRRIGYSSGRDRDHLDHRCGRNFARENCERSKRIHDMPLYSSDNRWCIESEYNDRRNMKRWPFSFYSSEEPYSLRWRRFPCFSGLKSGVPERNTRCLWKEQNIENGQYGTGTRERLQYGQSEDLVRRRPNRQSSDAHVMKESIKDDYDEDIFFRRKRHQHSEVLHSRGEVYKSRQQNDSMFYSEEPSYRFENFTRNYRTDDRHSVGHDEDHINEREANRERIGMIREQDSYNQFGGSRKSIKDPSHAEMHPGYQDSIDPLIVVGRKCIMQSSRRTLEAEEEKYSDRRDLFELNVNQKSVNLEGSYNFHSENAVLKNEDKVNISLGDKTQPSKFSKHKHEEFLEIEEGQIITEDLMKRVHPSEDMLQINNKGQPETSSDANVVVQGLDDVKIQEILVKMERRRERFKEPITSCRDSVKASHLLADLDAECNMAKLERPTRKRRWCGT